jgi:hypothetical protein
MERKKLNNIDEDIDKASELLCTAGGITKWFTWYWKLYEVSSKT